VDLSDTTKDALGGTDILYAIGCTLPDAKVEVSEIDNVIAAIFAVILEATTVLILFTEFTAGVNPVNKVEPSYVQLVAYDDAVFGVK
jgi:hypothetical protein